MNKIAITLEQVKERIAKAAHAAGRDPDTVRLVAVSKTMPLEMIEQALEAGQRDFGENYIQEAVNKVDTLSGRDICWHFIGHLQRNKAKFVPGRFKLMHSVDSLRLAEALNRRAGAEGLVQQVLVQVNISDEQSKSGIDSAGLRELLIAISELGNVKVLGLMTMPPFLPNEQARPYFRELIKLREQVAPHVPANVSLDELSMGMTGDLEAAIEFGATIVRVGTAIFGARQGSSCAIGETD
ncbi:MAG: YggS family pyridoxal phosphate-dependent enzyme [Candidatus Alcyoniella australis]|nr:YggS family pyridoxal phosphate-dependent enzyme [Candidatus Alcyoniella australis]